MAERGHLLDKCSLLYFFQKISRVHHRSREGQPKPGLNKKRMLNIVKQQWYTGWSEVTNYPSWLTHLLVIAGKYFPETTTNQTIQKPIICVCVCPLVSINNKENHAWFFLGAPPFDDQRFGNPSMRVLNHHGTFNITHFRSNWVVIKRSVHWCICQPSYLHLHPNVELEHAKNTTWKTKTTTLWQSNMAIGNPRAKWRFIAGKIFINEGFPLPWKWLPEGKSMYIPSIIIKNIINLPLAFH